MEKEGERDGERTKPRVEHECRKYKYFRFKSLNLFGNGTKLDLAMNSQT